MSDAKHSKGGGTHGACLPPSGYPAGETPEGPPEIPVLDLGILRGLEEEVGGTGVARNFALDYIGIWDKRRTYLEHSVEGHDVEQAMDALISVKISALMVGASRLATLAVEAECLLRAGDLTAVQLLLPDLAQTGEETVTALRIGYLTQNE